MEVPDPLAFFKALVKRYGDPCTFNICMHPCVFLVKDEDVAWALKQERKGNAGAFVLEYLQRVVGKEAIMFQAGEHHKRLRKIFEPAFTPLAIRDYLSVMDQVTQETLARLSKTGDFSEPREWALLALRIFCRCAFGEVNEEQNQKLCNLCEGWINGMDTIIPFALPFTPLAKSYQCKNKLGKLLREMIAEFKAQARPEHESTRKSLLGRLVYSVDEDGNPPTEAQMIDNILFIIFAGFDTTKSSFGAISLYLTENRTIYQLLVEEVSGFADPLDFDELKCAPILNAVLAETWRLNAPLSSHTVRANCDLEYKEYRFPKGTLLVLDTQSYHEINEELYPDASTFRIERWLPKGHQLYNPKYHVDIDYNVMSTKYRPFNMGAHMCLGAHFAKLEVRVVVTRLLQKYDVEIRNPQIRKFPTLQRVSDFKLTERE